MDQQMKLIIQINEKYRKTDSLTFGARKKLRKDYHSINADPHFINAPAFYFHFRRTGAIRKIKFVPFDYTQAGVYGTEAWKELARFNRGLEMKFDRVIEANERRQ